MHHLALGAELTPPPAALDEILVMLDEIGPPDGSKPSVGPCSLGDDQQARDGAAVADMARLYAGAARSGQRVIPYFEMKG